MSQNATDILILLPLVIITVEKVVNYYIDPLSRAKSKGKTVLIGIVLKVNPILFVDDYMSFLTIKGSMKL